MTIFSWKDDSIIRKMEVRPYGKKGAEAVLFAGDADRKDLLQLADHMRSLGWSVVPDVEDGQHVVHLRGFQQPQEIIGTLEKNRSVFGEYKTQDSSPQPKPKLKPMDRVRRVSLVAAGYAFGLGDIALMTVGKLRNNASGNSEFMSGLAFSTSSLLLMRYGKKKPEKSFKELHDRMLGQFVTEGIEIPGAQYLDLKTLGKPGGVASRLDHFLYEHPAEMNCAINTYAGYRMADAGMKMRKDDPKAGALKATAGTVLMAANTISLLVPEKPKSEHPDAKKQEKEEKQKKGPAHAVMNWVQEKPMRVIGYMAVINNFFQLASALTERKHSRNATGKARHFWALNLAASLSYMSANALLAISPKDANASMHDEAKDPFADIYTSAAAILVNQPEEKRELLVNKMAFYLSSQPEIRNSPQEVAQIITHKLSEVKDSPWIDNAPSRSETVHETRPVSRESEKESKRWAEREGKAQDAEIAWADKEMARDTAGKEPSLAGNSR